MMTHKAFPRNTFLLDSLEVDTFTDEETLLSKEGMI